MQGLLYVSRSRFSTSGRPTSGQQHCARKPQHPWSISWLFWVGGADVPLDRIAWLRRLRLRLNVVCVLFASTGPLISTFRSSVNRPRVSIKSGGYETGLSGSVRVEQ